MANIQRATAYPGTPSTSILETINRITNIPCSWSINEKVALEDIAGVSFAGGRGVCIMKSVGLNVASDPLMTLSYTGVFGALVIVICDDPGAYSSQNEQDNRNYAKFAKLPMLEPSTPEECYLFFKEAVTISEKFDTPVLFRMTTRVCTNKTPTNLETFQVESIQPKITFPKEQDKLIMTPKQAKIRHAYIEDRLKTLQELSSTSTLNTYLPGKNKDKLLVTSGASYLYVKELYPNTSIIKVGLTYPMPINFIKEIAKSYKQIICVEELDPFMEELLLISGIPNVQKKATSFYIMDYNLKRVRNLVDKNKEDIKDNSTLLPPPPPTLCSGCPHITILSLMRDLDLNVCGDIGCYTIGSQSPHYAMQTVLDMGASLPMSTGMSMILPPNEKKRLAAIIGDSTFFHSGITGLIDAVQNKSNALIFILDNSATAMTGRQGHAGIGNNLLNADSPKVDYIKLMNAIGINNVSLLDPYDFSSIKENIEQAMTKDEMHVFIMRRECALLNKEDVGEKKVITTNCVNCRDCLRLGCPAIYYDHSLRSPQINLDECIGCDICIAACEFDSIVSLSDSQKQTIKAKQEKNHE